MMGPAVKHYGLKRSRRQKPKAGEHRARAPRQYGKPGNLQRVAERRCSQK